MALPFMMDREIFSLLIMEERIRAVPAFVFTHYVYYSFIHIRNLLPLRTFLLSVYTYM